MSKLAKNFEELNGVVGLGIVAAMDENRAALLPISPMSSRPIPIMSQRNNSLVNKRFSFEDMEMCEEYTCVISYVGNDLVKKTEYFDGDFLGVSEVKKSPVAAAAANSYQISSGVAAYGSPESWIADFLNSCYLCNKKLLGLDIFMYRGEKAFCSAECRYTQMSIDEHKHKCGSGVIKPTDYYSVSPCSGPMHCFSGVAAA